MLRALMRIFLVRHAIAVPRGGDALDHARPLTAKGRRRFQQEVGGLDRLGIRFDRVYHSPWVRAVQTAELLDPLNDGDRVPTEHLAASPDKPLLDQLRSESVAVVGHEPWMGELCGLLLFGDAGAGHLFSFKKGGVAHLEGIATPGGAELCALYPPKVLRMAAEK
jgi:phosphohistidine phosphatase